MRRVFAGDGAGMMFAALQSDGTQNVWTVAIVAAVLLFGIVGIILYLIRRFFQDEREEHERSLAAAPRTENPTAFMAASMHGVIQKLRDQEKELERLHRIEKDRAEQTERLSEEVTRNMPAGLVVVNATGIISSANPAAEQVLGIRALGFRRYTEVLGETSELSGLVAQCLENGKIFRREEVHHLAPGGENRRLGVTISPIRRGEGKINGAICLLSDLTELMALQQQVQLKENLAAVGELSAGIAHEFKNALATISGYAQLICAETIQGETHDYAENILEQTRNITHVVTEFLKYARPLDVGTEAVGLQAVIERVVNDVSEALPNIRIRCEGAFASVAGDEALLRQAFLNLARNGAEACAEAANGGRVLLRGETVRGESTGFQRITVFDNGPGIPVDAREKLFRPFFTTKASGTGLGLAVVQKIVVQHGGHVKARNRPEGGAAFIVTLPLSSEVPEAVESKQEAV
jgi:PAS domain S-box-containing protein